MLGADCWSSSLQCTIERHAIGHRRRHRRCTLLSSLSHHALSLSHRARHHCRAMPLAVVAHHRRRHHASSSSSLRRRLATPRAVVHRRCTVVPLSCCWIRRRRLPPLSLLHCLCRRAIRRRRRGAIGRRRRCHRFVISRDRRRALVRDAWALQPGGGWLGGVALAPPDCSGGCALWWALVVAVCAVGCWVIGTVRLCAVPGPLGLVDGGCGGCVGCTPIAFAVVALCRRGCHW